LAVVIGTGLLFIATTTPIGPAWDALPLVSKFQFPWRLASVMTLAVAVLISWLPGRRAWLMVGLAIAVTIPFVGWDRTVPLSTFSSPKPDRPRPGTVFPDPWVAWEAGSGGWYWRHHTLAEIWFLAAGSPPFLLSDLAGGRAPELDSIRHRPAVVVERPELPVEVVAWGPLEREIAVDNRGSSTVVWRAIRFPTMGVSIDGRPVDVFTEPTTGLVAHRMPPGRHVARWSWRPFPALRWARFVSMCGIGVLAMLFAAALLQQLRSRFRGPLA
jgi:hypothetical protein